MLYDLVGEGEGVTTPHIIPPSHGSLLVLFPCNRPEQGGRGEGGLLVLSPPIVQNKNWEEFYSLFSSTPLPLSLLPPLPFPSLPFPFLLFHPIAAVSPHTRPSLSQLC